MSLKIRRYRESDTKTLTRVYFESVRNGTMDFYSKEQREAWAPAIPDTDTWKSRLAPMIVFVAEDDSGIVGFMTLEDNGYIDLAFVRPDRIATGVASELYKHVEETSRELQQERLFSDASEMARRFFDKRGWVVKRKRIIERDGVELTNYRMEKLLV